MKNNKKINEVINKLKIKELEHLTEKEVIKKYKNSTLYLNKSISWIDQKEIYNISIEDNNNNIYLFSKIYDYNKKIYNYYIYNIYTGSKKEVKNNYQLELYKYIEEINKTIRKNTEEL